MFKNINHQFKSSLKRKIGASALMMIVCRMPHFDEFRQFAVLNHLNRNRSLMDFLMLTCLMA